MNSQIENIILEISNTAALMNDTGSSSNSTDIFLPNLKKPYHNLYILFSLVRIFLFFYGCIVSAVQIIHLYRGESTISLRLVVAKFLVFLYISLFCLFRTVGFLIRLPVELYIEQMIGTYGTIGIVYQIITQCGTLLVLLSWSSIGFYWMHLLYVLQQRNVASLMKAFKVIQFLVFCWMASLIISFSVIPQRQNKKIATATSIIFYTCVILFGIFFVIKGRKLMTELRKMMKTSWGETHSKIHYRRTVLLLACLFIVTLVIVLKTIFSLFIFKESFVNQWKVDFISAILELAMVVIISFGVSGSYPWRLFCCRDAGPIKEKKSNSMELSSKHSDQSRTKSSSSSGSGGTKNNTNSTTISASHSSNINSTMEDSSIQSC